MQKGEERLNFACVIVNYSLSVSLIKKNIKMKKIVFCMLATLLSLTFIPLQSNAMVPEESSVLVDPKPAEVAEVKALELRLDEINAMDKSKLTSAEKKNLRKEVKSIKSTLREVGGGVYLSVAAIVLIVILLVVLL
jgi:hypothetical protein